MTPQAAWITPVGSVLCVYVFVRLREWGVGVSIITADGDSIWGTCTQGKLSEGKWINSGERKRCGKGRTVKWVPPVYSARRSALQNSRTPRSSQTDPGESYDPLSKFPSLKSTWHMTRSCRQEDRWGERFTSLSVYLKVPCGVFDHELQYDAMFCSRLAHGCTCETIKTHKTSMHGDAKHILGNDWALFHWLTGWWRWCTKECHMAPVKGGEEVECNPIRKHGCKPCRF